MAPDEPCHVLLQLAMLRPVHLLKRILLGKIVRVFRLRALHRKAGNSMHMQWSAFKRMLCLHKMHMLTNSVQNQLP